MQIRRVVILVGLGLFLCGTGWLLADRLEDTEYLPGDHPAILYNDLANRDAVGRLAERLDKGEPKLDYAADGTGYLGALLKELKVPVESQVLVFSRTSIQANRISPRTPRAIYFTDDVSIGFVQNGDVLEISALDPVKGAKMYTLDTERRTKPAIARRDDCLQCHQGPATLGIPGLLISSVHPSVNGKREEHGNAYMTDHRTEFNERFGGWYVTGTHGEQFHQGNNPQLVDPIRPGPERREGSQNVKDLREFMDTSHYPASSSDIVALMTLEHQVRMSNLLVRLGWETRMALQEGKLEGPQAEKKAQDVIANIADEVAGYMLFSGEPGFKEPIAGTSAFTKTFPARGPRDANGRSLREFDLNKRLFKYPLSYMIYSASFEQLPPYARNVLYQRIYDVVSGKEESKAYAHLSKDDRRAILEIVRATKKDLPSYWSE